MFGNNGKEEQVIKLAKGIVASHHEPWDMAYYMAYRYVYGKNASKILPSMESKIIKCQDYHVVSKEEYNQIRKVYFSSSGR